MQPTVRVRRLHEWAILPYKEHIDRAGPRQEADLLARHFRYHRQFRRPEACPPWVMGQELGWTVVSPISVTVSPLDDIQVAAADSELPEAGRLLGRDEFWRRGEGYIAAGRNDWLRTHQFRGIDGGWQGMFLPNGQGSVEWRLGWSIQIPEGCFLMVTAPDNANGIEIPTGVLTDRQVNRTWEEEGGFSAAMRPLRRVALTRGQPIARIVLLTRETLQARIEEIPSQVDS